jgi:hypothetical protein
VTCPFSNCKKNFKNWYIFKGALANVHASLKLVYFHGQLAYFEIKKLIYFHKQSTLFKFQKELQQESMLP